MKKIASLTGPAPPLNLSEKVDLQRNLNNECFAKITPETIALITLANADPSAKDSSLMLSTNQEWQLVKKRPSEMLIEFEQHTLHTKEDKEKIISVHFEKRYRLPVISGQVLLVPFDGPRKNETDWYNILLIEEIRPYHDVAKGVIDTLLIFKGGQKIILPRRPQAIMAKIKQTLHRAHFYFKLYDLILAADQQPPSPSLPMIEHRLRVLNLDLYPRPGEEVINEGLRKFRKLGQKCIHYLEVAEEECDY